MKDLPPPTFLHTYTSLSRSLCVSLSLSESHVLSHRAYLYPFTLEISI